MVEVADSPQQTRSLAVFATAPTTGRQKKLDTLTTFRFFAAAFIVIGHAAPSFNVHYALLDPFSGGQGVAFFYVLSGFILTYAYPKLDRAGTRRFLVARIARIWPMHLASIVLLILLLVMNSQITLDPVVVFLNTFLLQSWIPIAHYYNSFNPIAWSVSVELFFYFCFPFLLHNWRKTWALKLAVSFLMLCGMITLYNYGLRFLPQGTDVSGIVYYNPLARVFEFTVGIATAHIWMRVQPRVNVPRLIGTVIECASVLIVFAVGAQSGAWAKALQPLPFVRLGGLVWLINGGTVVLPIAVLVFVFALEAGWLSRFLAFAPLVILGEISFSIYLTHVTFLGYYITHQELFRIIPENWLWPAYWAVLVAACFVFWSLIEIPCRRGIVQWYDRRFSSRPARPVALAADTPHGWYRRLGKTAWFRGVTVALVLVTSLAVVIRASVPPFSTAGRVRTDIGVQWTININGADPSNTTPISISHASEPVIVGWAIDSTNNRLVNGVQLVLDDRVTVPMAYGQANPLIVSAFHNPGYLRAGFRGTLPLSKLTPGDHVVTLRIYVDNDHVYYESHKFGIAIT